MFSSKKIMMASDALSFVWTQQPTDQLVSSEITFSYSYETRKRITNTVWKRSDDGGATWSDTSDESIEIFSSLAPDGKIQANGSLRVFNPGTYVPGRIYRVEAISDEFVTEEPPSPPRTASPASVAATASVPLVFVSQSAGTTELLWTQQPSNQPLSEEIAFSYSYEKYQQTTNTVWKRSDDGGATWSDTSDEAKSIISSFGPDGKTLVGGSLTIFNPGTYVPGRIYRVEVIRPVGEPFVSQSAGVV